MPPMRYIDYSMENPECVHAILSNRAYAAILSEVLRNGRNETGGVLIGNIYKRVWYIVDSIDPGLNTVNEQAYFTWETNYVNHLASYNGCLYKYPLTILGFWHRHPGSMDYFSSTDERTIRLHLKDFPHGLLSMLINIDPELRMTFYYCFRDEIMPIRCDHGDEYFPRELLEYATPEDLIGRSRRSLRIKPEKWLPPEKLPRSINPADRRQDSRQAEPSQEKKAPPVSAVPASGVPAPPPVSAAPAPGVPSSPPSVSTAPASGISAANRPRITEGKEIESEKGQLASHLTSLVENEVRQISKMYAERVGKQSSTLTSAFKALLESKLPFMLVPYEKKATEPEKAAARPVGGRQAEPPGGGHPAAAEESVDISIEVQYRRAMPKGGPL